MFVRYADNFLSGYGVAWNRDGIQTYGTTSILYLFVVISLRWIFAGADSSRLLIYASACLGMISIGSIAITCLQILRPNLQRRYWVPVIAFFTLFLFSPTFRFHATSGMDTTTSILANSFLCFASLRWVKRDTTLSLILTILAGYLTFLARPDNLIYALLFPPLCVLVLSEGDRKTNWRHFLAGIFLILLIDTVLKRLVFGDALPLPFYAKTSGYYEGYLGAYKWNPVIYLFDFARLVAILLVMTVLFVRANSAKYIVAFLTPVAITFGYYFSVVQVMGLEARYYLPAMPFFAICAFAVWGCFIENAHGGLFEGLLGDKFIRLKLIVLLVFLSFLQPAVVNYLGNLYQRMTLSFEQKYGSVTTYETDSKRLPPELGWWPSIQAMSGIVSDLPEGTKLAMSEYGYIGANAPGMYIIDPLGLNDPVFAHDGFSAQEFFGRKPDLIWLPHPDYTKIFASILDSEIFIREYDFYPGAFDYGVAVRRDSKNYEAIIEAFRLGWLENYPNLDMDSFLAHPIPGN